MFVQIRTSEHHATSRDSFLSVEISSIGSSVSLFFLIYTNLYIYIYIYIYIYLFTYIYIYLLTYIYIYTHRYACIYIYNIHMYARIYIYIYIYIPLFIYVLMCFNYPHPKLLSPGCYSARITKPQTSPLWTCPLKFVNRRVARSRSRGFRGLAVRV